MADETEDQVLVENLSSFWNPFFDSTAILHILHTGQVASNVPISISAGLRFLSAYKISDYWTGLSEVSNYDGLEELDVARLDETLLLLTEAGFKHSIAKDCLIALLAACLRNRYESIDLPCSQWDEVLSSIAKAMLAGCLGLPNQKTIEWVLKLSNKENTQKPSLLLSLLDQSANGDSDARRELVKIILPYWKEVWGELLENGWSENSRSLGFLFEYVDTLEDYPDILAWKAEVLYNFGEHGDEKRAFELVADAAYLGSMEAWALIDNWSDNTGEISHVMRALIDVGIEKFCEDGDV